MDKIDAVRKCVEKWVEIRPVLDGWLKYDVSYTSEWQSLIIRIGVPSRFTNTKEKRLYYYQQEQVPLEILKRVDSDLPNYISHLMFKLVTEVITSTIQPKIQDIYLTPLSPISAAEKEYLEIHEELRNAISKG